MNVFLAFLCAVFKVREVPFGLSFRTAAGIPQNDIVKRKASVSPFVSTAPLRLPASLRVRRPWMPPQFPARALLRKEVIQPHLPIRLPCYDFTPVIGLTFGGCPLRWLTDFGCSRLPWCDGRCVQGPGTYSPRHADSRLLATPTSCGRVAAHNPN